MGNTEQKMSIQSGYVLVERPQDYEVVWSEQPASLLELSAYCMEVGCRKVLIMGPKTKVRLAMTEIYQLGQEIAKLGLQIAVVELHDASNRNVEFLEDVAKNRGGPIQFFGNEKDAKDWLGVS